MKVGDKVKVTSRPSSSPYLTVSRVYDVIDADGDGFEIIDDAGDMIYCIFPSCLHASWEIAE